MGLSSDVERCDAIVREVMETLVCAVCLRGPACPYPWCSNPCVGRPGRASKASESPSSRPAHGGQGGAS